VSRRNYELMLHFNVDPFKPERDGGRFVSYAPPPTGAPGQQTFHWVPQWHGGAPLPAPSHGAVHVGADAGTSGTPVLGARQEPAIWAPPGSSNVGVGQVQPPSPISGVVDAYGRSWPAPIASGGSNAEAGGRYVLVDVSAARAAGFVPTSAGPARDHPLQHGHDSVGNPLAASYPHVPAPPPSASDSTIHARASAGGVDDMDVGYSGSVWDRVRGGEALHITTSSMGAKQDQDNKTEVMVRMIDGCEMRMKMNALRGRFKEGESAERVVGVFSPRIAPSGAGSVGHVSEELYRLPVLSLFADPPTPRAAAEMFGVAGAATRVAAEGLGWSERLPFWAAVADFGALLIREHLYAPQPFHDVVTEMLWTRERALNFSTQKPTHAELLAYTVLSSRASCDRRLANMFPMPRWAAQLCERALQQVLQGAEVLKKDWVATEPRLHARYDHLAADRERSLLSKRIADGTLLRPDVPEGEERTSALLTILVEYEGTALTTGAVRERVAVATAAASQLSRYAAHAVILETFRCWKELQDKRTIRTRLPSAQEQWCDELPAAAGTTAAVLLTSGPAGIPYVVARRFAMRRIRTAGWELLHEDLDRFANYTGLCLVLVDRGGHINVSGRQTLAYPDPATIVWTRHQARAAFVMLPPPDCRVETLQLRDNECKRDWVFHQTGQALRAYVGKLCTEVRAGRDAVAAGEAPGDFVDFANLFAYAEPCSRGSEGPARGTGTRLLQKEHDAFVRFPNRVGLGLREYLVALDEEAGTSEDPCGPTPVDKRPVRDLISTEIQRLQSFRKSTGDLVYTEARRRLCRSLYPDDVEFRCLDFADGKDESVCGLREWWGWRRNGSRDLSAGWQVQLHPSSSAQQAPQEAKDVSLFFVDWKLRSKRPSWLADHTPVFSKAGVLVAFTQPVQREDPTRTAAALPPLAPRASAATDSAAGRSRRSRSRKSRAGHKGAGGRYPSRSRSRRARGSRRGRSRSRSRRSRSRRTRGRGSRGDGSSRRAGTPVGATSSRSSQASTAPPRGTEKLRGPSGARADRGKDSRPGRSRSPARRSGKGARSFEHAEDAKKLSPERARDDVASLREQLARAEQLIKEQGKLLLARTNAGTSTQRTDFSLSTAADVAPPVSSGATAATATTLTETTERASGATKWSPHTPATPAAVESASQVTMDESSASSFKQGREGAIVIDDVSPRSQRLRMSDVINTTITPPARAADIPVPTQHTSRYRSAVSTSSSGRGGQFLSATPQMLSFEHASALPNPSPSKTPRRDGASPHTGIAGAAPGSKLDKSLKCRLEELTDSERHPYRWLQRTRMSLLAIDPDSNDVDQIRHAAAALRGKAASVRDRFVDLNHWDEFVDAVMGAVTDTADVPFAWRIRFQDYYLTAKQEENESPAAWADRLMYYAEVAGRACNKDDVGSEIARHYLRHCASKYSLLAAMHLKGGAQTATVSLRDAQVQLSMFQTIQARVGTPSTQQTAFAGAVTGVGSGCFRCGDLGHLAADCPAPTATAGIAHGVICHNCQRRGHLARDCHSQPRDVRRTRSASGDRNDRNRHLDYSRDRNHDSRRRSDGNDRRGRSRSHDRNPGAGRGADRRDGGRSRSTERTTPNRDRSSDRTARRNDGHRGSRDASERRSSSAPRHDRRRSQTPFTGAGNRGTPSQPVPRTPAPVVLVAKSNSGDNVEPARQ
jgi:hypothetical protein